MPPSPPNLVAHPHADTFQEQLRDTLRAAPWYAVSVAFHAVLLLVLSNLVWSSQETTTAQTIICGAPEEWQDVLDDKLVPPDETPPDEIEKEIDDPQVIEPDVDDVPTEDDPATPLSLVSNRNLNDVIGVGGGGLHGGPTGKYRNRGTGKGGGVVTQKSVGLGLRWLARHQDPGGFWDCDDFANRCQTNLCSGKGDALHDVGVTGLSLLAFLGAGNTMTSGPYKKVVNGGLRYLASVQEPDSGRFGPQAGQQFLYDHALATLAMVEGYTLSGVPLLKDPAQRGLDYISRARNPYGAWRYAMPADGDNDVSVTGWMLFALFAGQDAGLRVDEAAIQDAMRFVDSMTDPATGRTGYHECGSLPAREPADLDAWPADRSESMTAVALLLRAFDHQDPRQTPAVQRGTDLLLQRLPDWDTDAGSIDFYYWYYGSYALWQVGGNAWERWQRQLVPSVVDHQRQDGDECGSWDPQVDPWGDQGGRVYATALNTLTLEVYYRYDKVFGVR